MTSLADDTIAALRSTHDDLAPLVRDLSTAQLSAPSGASEWTVAQVLSHLGSGAEISQAGFRAALDEAPAPDDDFNQGVWPRWNELSPRAQADGFLEHDAALVDAFESLTSHQRESLQLKLGFVPAPLPIAAIAGLRLNEAAQHSWDVRVALDPAATLDAGSAAVLVEHFNGELGFLLGFIGKTDSLSEPVVLELQSSDAAILIEDHISLSKAATGATATFTGELEAALRLITGRLTSAYTPASVEVTGNVSLDDLRRVFPGY